jgi:RimJ/RimL family protein N-acetyltransferase
MNIILETPRLILRRQMIDDLDDLWALYSDPEVTRYIPDAPHTYAETRAELEWHRDGHPQNPSLGLWATIYKSSGRFIGRCGLLPWTIEGREEVEVAYTLAREFWGQGLATEAAAAIRDYAFERLDLARLICLIDPQNLASLRVAEKIGMQRECEMDGWEGDGIPFYIYSSTRETGA